MADFIDHVKQANHNQNCAAKFANSRDTLDWAITAAFYSAIHFVEAGIATTNMGHSHVSCPSDTSLHDHRQDLVRKNYRSCYRNYRSLRQASQAVRYLSDQKTGLASNYYSNLDVKEFVHTDLQTIKTEIEAIVKVELE